MIFSILWEQKLIEREYDCPSYKKNKWIVFPSSETLKFLAQLVERANEWTRYLGIEKSVHFVMSNVTVSLEVMLSTYPGLVHSIAIQFPDPHFKAKHRKRHIVQKGLVESCSKILTTGGTKICTL